MSVNGRFYQLVRKIDAALVVWFRSEVAPHYSSIDRSGADDPDPGRGYVHRAATLQGSEDAKHPMIDAALTVLACLLYTSDAADE